MKKSILFRSNTLFLILLLFLLSLNLFAEQHNTVSVSGKVKNATTYAGILHAKILLEGDNSYETYSDQNGNFSFDNVVPTSVYTLIVRKSSYEEFSQSINVDTNNVNLRNISLFKSPENPEVYIGNLDYTEDLYNFPFEWHSAEKYTQTLYFKEEINNEYYMGGDTPITSIKYRYNSSMSDQLTFPVKIWMANREETEFTQGDSYYYFFFPVTESKLVWEGEVVIQPGSDNELEIVLDQPFYYTGNSLLISIYHSQIHTSDYYIYFKGTNPPSSNVRTVHSGEYSSAAVNVYYPGYGYFDNRYINTQLTFGTAGYASVFGVVTNNNELVTDAKISIQGTDRFVTTDSNGRYQLDYIEPGLTTLIASYENYNDTLYEDLELTADSSQEYNFELSPQTTITISGQVNDSLTGQGIENAKILISGYEDYEAITNSSGAFTFTNISSGQAYDIKVLKTNYEISSIQIQAENDDIALGTINLVHGSNIIEQFIGNPESVLAKHLYPVNLSYKYSLTQTYYMPEEISSEYHFGEGSLITSLSYYIDTDGVLVEPYAMKVWLANATSFTPNGFALWVPMEEFTLVFDGTIDLSNAGTYPVEIEFSEPFEYEGNELIVMVKKNDLNQYIGNGKIDWVRTYTPYYNGRTHFYGTNQQDLEPEGYYGDKTSFVPNTKFNFITSDYSSINGTITQNGSPIENVKVAIDGTNRYTFSDAQGNYTLNYVPTGNISITASKHFYLDNTAQLIVNNDQVTTHDFNLSNLPTVTVSGDIIGNDTEQSLPYAVITLKGYDNYQTVSSNMGVFNIENVYINQNYTMNITVSGYNVYTAEIQVADSNLDLGTITLNKYLNPPKNIHYQIVNHEVLLNWLPPEENRQLNKRNIIHENKLAINDRFENLTGYQIWKFKSADLEDTDQWTLLEDDYTETTYTDISWHDDQENEYMYAVIAKYDHIHLSEPCFTNPIEKIRYGLLKFIINTFDGQSPVGAIITIKSIDQNSSFEQTIKVQASNTFMHLNYGNYYIKISKPGYALHINENFEFNQEDVAYPTITLGATGYFLHEDFDGSEFPPTEWQLKDADQDSHNWFLLNHDGVAYSGTGCAASASYINNIGPIQADNYLISPAIIIPESRSSCWLKYRVAAQDDEYTQEQYSVLLAIGNPSLANFTEVYSETINSTNYEFREVNLNVSPGETIYIAFRHHTDTDQFIIKIDDIKLSFSLSDDDIISPTIKTALYANYPNPFNPETNISFDLENNANVSINIYNIKGQKVKTLVNDRFNAGSHSIIWNGKNDNDKSVGSGIYFYNMKSGKYTSTRKMILMK